MTITNPWGTSQTQFFYKLTPEALLDAIEKSLGRRSTGRIMTLNSMENRVYEVELEDSGNNDKCESVIAKFYRPGRWFPEQIEEEHQFLADLIAEEIPAVAPFELSNGLTLDQLPDSGILFSIFPKISGRSPDELDEDEALQVGRLIARMHNVGASRTAPNRIKLSIASYGEESLRYLKDHHCVPKELEDSYFTLASQMLVQGAPHIASLPTQRIHGDGHLGNLLRGRNGLFWVDFDDMVTGPCIQDLWLLLPSRDAYGRKQLFTLVEGYRQMREFDMQSVRGIEILRSLRMLHFSAWIAKRWEDPAFPKAFPQFGTFAYWRNQLDDFREQISNIEESDFWLDEGSTEMDC